MKIKTEIVKKTVIRYLKRYVVDNMRVIQKAVEKSAELNGRATAYFFAEVGIDTSNTEELKPVFHVSHKEEHLFDGLEESSIYPIGVIDSREFGFWEEDDSIPVYTDKYDSVLEEGFEAFAKDCL